MVFKEIKIIKVVFCKIILSSAILCLWARFKSMDVRLYTRAARAIHVHVLASSCLLYIFGSSASNLSFPVLTSTLGYSPKTGFLFTCTGSVKVFDSFSFLKDIFVWVQ